MRLDGRDAFGMVVPRVFSTEGVSPYDQVEWDLRAAEIKDERGKIIFRQADCAIPKTWSQLATNVVASKYFYGENGTSERESSVRQLVDRVTRTIADWGREDGYFADRDDAERFYDELTALCLNQYGSFNSPVWFNVGLFHRYGINGPANNRRYGRGRPARSSGPTAMPTSIPRARPASSSSVGDDMQDDHEAGHLRRGDAFKFGSGTGTDLSTLRSSKEKPPAAASLRPGQLHAGLRRRSPASCKSGGKTRRACATRCRLSRSGTPTSSNSSSASRRKRKRLTH